MSDATFGILLAAVPWGIIALRLIYCMIFWRTYDETWAWIHERHRLTGEERHIQKVQGVPMAPPPSPPGSPMPSRPSR
ncbi:hypothetical protein [Sphingomonas xinjiangensis]|uniref:Uncharacterized protein n=1 Tax=Sphingomonas xinjiangensis TaxID=643568 RepID=A0A840YPF8_9SPHN|nr:hypothetical protein [Sphingomonas xinjiangensis]MBB5709343.1 hypothetical protein [Sphingomonas xinjiangensis]